MSNVLPYDGSLWQSTMEAAARDKRRKADGTAVVARREIVPEMTPFGLLRWYLHPQLDEPVIKSLYFLEIEIPAGSRSGKLRHQGGIAHMVVAGSSGYTMLSGVRYDWTASDVIGVPPRPEGVTLQHFNAGNTPVRIVMAFPNYDSALGPELGVDLAVLEPAPEYRE